MEWNELRDEVRKLQRPPRQKLQQAPQQQIRRRFAELSIGGIGGSIEEVLHWLATVDVSETGAEAHRYALRALDDILDMGQATFVRDSLEDLVRHFREAIEELRKQQWQASPSPPSSF